MSDVVIRAESLGKKYLIGHQSQSGGYVALRDVVAQNARALWSKTRDLAQGRPVTLSGTLEEVWALKDVNFEIRRGEAVGIIGRNGAGKSTLLKILSRITEPSAGRVTIRGRVASLLEVGTGFHPELTGRENVYLNGAILGMTRTEIRRKFDEIVAFAEIEKFLDTPVKRYSSGMYMRLAFAVAAHLEPEILVVDEVLAVGDAEFQKKCLGKMGEVAGTGRTVLFVSHNMQAVLRLCPRSIWLQNGAVNQIGDSDTICGAYLAARTQRGEGGFTFHDFGEHVVFFIELKMYSSSGELTNVFRADEPLRFRVIYRVLQPIASMTLGLNILDSLGGSLWAASELDCHPELFDRVREPGDYELNIAAPGNVLRPGTYQVALGAASGGQYHHHPQDFPAFEVTTDGYWRQSHRFFGLGGGPLAVPMDISTPLRVSVHP